MTQSQGTSLIGLEAALGEHLAIGLAFVGVSWARGYVLRRLRGDPGLVTWVRYADLADGRARGQMAKLRTRSRTEGSSRQRFSRMTAQGIA